MRLKSAYMICATPRSGSALLCKALCSTGIAGIPEEYFGPMHVPKWREEWRLPDDADYVEHVVTHGSTPNGVFGVKIMKLYWDHFIKTLKQAVKPELASDCWLIESTFPNISYIWITRRNKIRQGVSWAKAMQGVPWIWEEDMPFVPEKKMDFRFDVIDQFISETVMHEAAWQAYFTEHGIEPFVVVYEDFVQSFEATTRSILDFLKIPNGQDVPIERPTLKQQADKLSDEWEQQYLLQMVLEWQERGWNRIGY